MILHRNKVQASRIWSCYYQKHNLVPSCSVFSKTIPVQNAEEATNEESTIADVLAPKKGKPTTTKLSPGFLMPHVQDLLPSIIEDQWKTKIRMNPSSGFVEVRECHLCNKQNKNKPDNIWKLGIRANGSYHCFRCSDSGNWADFKEKACGVNISEEEKLRKEKESAESSSSAPPKPFEPPKIIPFFQTQMQSGTNVSSDSNNPISSAPSSPFQQPPKNNSPSSSSSYTSPSSSSSTADPNIKINFPHQSLHLRYHLNLFPSRSEEIKTEFMKNLLKNRKLAKDYLHDNRKLNDIVLKKYKIGFTLQTWIKDDDSDNNDVFPPPPPQWVEHVCVTFPWIIPTDQVNLEKIHFLESPFVIKSRKTAAAAAAAAAAATTTTPPAVNETQSPNEKNSAEEEVEKTTTTTTPITPGTPPTSPTGGMTLEAYDEYRKTAPVNFFTSKGYIVRTKFR
jgi:hypothetical protein